jgi:hypothetical protein
VQTEVMRTHFLSVLQSVQLGLSTREIVEQATCFVFKDGKVYTDNGEVSCQRRSGLPTEATGAVKAKNLTDLLGKLTEDNLKIEFLGSELGIGGKNRRAGIRLEKEILLNTEIKLPKDWKKLHDDFGEAIDLVRECAGNDDTYSYLTCVHIHPHHVEACDNDQFCRWKMETPIKESVLVKHEAVKGLGPLAIREVGETKERIHFRNDDNLIVSCRKYLEEFPEFDPYLVVEGGNSTTIPSGLKDVLDRTKIFSGDNPEGQRKVKVTLKNGVAKLRGEGVNGWYEERKKIRYTGNTVTFMTTPKVLTDIAKRHTECIVSETRMKVDGEYYQYVTCLDQVSD